jgi:hypothetical protein
MTDAMRADRDLRPLFPYSPDELARIILAVRNEAYPPEGRSGIGTVLRQPHSCARCRGRFAQWLNPRGGSAARGCDRKPRSRS